MNTVTKFLRHLFIPHDKNNYRARLLHTDFLSIYLAAALLISFVFNQPAAGKVLGYATDISITKLFQLTNEERTKNGLPALTLNDKLTAAAEAKAKDMFSKNYWAHYGPDGTTPWTFILGAGYQYEYAGENLAKNFMYSQGVVDAWMNSPTHKENLMRKEYTDVGYAIVNGQLNGEETTLVVQTFGKPLSAQMDTANNDHDVIPETNGNVLPAGDQQIAPAEENNNIMGTSIPTFLNFNLIFLSILMVVLLIDLYVASKMKFIRIGGKNVVHFIFIGFIIIALIILKNGAII